MFRFHFIVDDQKRKIFILKRSIHHGALDPVTNTGGLNRGQWQQKRRRNNKKQKRQFEGKKGRQHVIICEIFTFFSISSPIKLDNQDVYFDNLSTIASFVPLYDLYLTLLFTITILIENFSVLAFLSYDQSNGRVLWQMSRILY